jgi:hypothetical protein
MIASLRSWTPMPRSMLRHSIEKLDKAERDRYLAVKRR